jgi:GTP-binding protein
LEPGRNLVRQRPRPRLRPYKRYLEGFFRNKFELIGTPMAIEFRTGRNPYAGKPQKKRR